jgi:hypothetical protein
MRHTAASNRLALVDFAERDYVVDAWRAQEHHPLAFPKLDLKAECLLVESE